MGGYCYNGYYKFTFLVALGVAGLMLTFAECAERYSVMAKRIIKVPN